MLPAHVVNEYCHPSRSFDPTPQFNEDRLPRSLEFYQDTNTTIAFWFPLSASHLSADKVFTIVRAGWRLYAFGGHKATGRYEIDLAAMITLANTRYAKLVQLTQQLKQQALLQEEWPEERSTALHHGEALHWDLSALEKSSSSKSKTE